MKSRLLLIFLSLCLLLTSCPEPPDNELECGVHQIEVNGTCECEEGYHWNEDETQCLLDTTSHNFVWEIDTLGEWGSYLNDVAIVDENNIWVVGNVETDSGEFNAARWYGNEWELVNIEADYNGVIISPDLYSIFYFSDDDIWTLGSYPFHWDGDKWAFYQLTDMGIISGGLSGEIWGSNSNDVYFVGRNGRIIHYDGTSFTKMQSGTTVDLTDIYGIDENHIWAIGDDDGLGIGESITLFFNGSEWTTKFHYIYNQPVEGIPVGSYRAIWATEDTLFIRCGQGLWRESIETGEGYLESVYGTTYPSGVSRKIRGISDNDFFDVGDFQKLFHYNGETWYRYIPFDLSNINAFYSVAYVDPNTVFVVGDKYVYRGYRMSR